MWNKTRKLNELKKNCIFITSGTLTFMTIFIGSMNIYSILLYYRRDCLDHTPCVSLPVAFIYKCFSFLIKVNILFQPTQIMVLYKIESQDQSVDIFIKMGKSNVSPAIPQHHWHMYVWDLNYVMDFFLNINFAEFAVLHSVFKKCYVPFVREYVLSVL